MSKKVVTILMVLAISLCFGKDFQNVRDIKVISRSENHVVIESDGLIHQMQKVTKTSNNALEKTTTTSVLDTILRFTPPRDASYYDDMMADYHYNGCLGGMKDTVIKRFTLIAPGYIKKVMMQNKHAGTAELQFWGPCFYHTDDSRWVNLPESGYTSGEVNIPGASPFLQYSATLECEAHVPTEQFNDAGQWIPQWNVFDMDVLYPGMNPLLTGDSTELWVGYVTDGVSGPSIWQDYEYTQDAGWWWDRYSFSTLKSVDPSPANYYNVGSDNDAGDRNGINHMIQIVVEYTAVPPFIENAVELSNMYSTEATVYADVFDLDSDVFTAKIQYKIGSNGDKQYIDMTATGNGDEYAGTISASVGDTVYYVVKAEDSDGLYQFSTENYQNYIIKEKPSGKNILVIREGGTKNDSLYYEVLGDENTVYWIMDDEGGLHESVVNAGFDVIFMTGFGTTVVPIFTEKDKYGIGEYLDNNGDLILCDPDWAFENTLSTALYVVDLKPGDFAYDYFGIDSLVNDPNDGSNSTADINFVGTTGDIISSDFADGTTYGPLMYSILGKTNWGDFAYPNSATTSSTIFTGSDNSISAGVLNNTDTYMTLYCGFWPEVVASEQFSEFETFVNNVLHNTTAIEEVNNSIVTEFSLNQNYPNPFNPTTNIAYSIPVTGQMSLKIYDISGKLVKTLHNDVKSQGRYTAIWDARNDFGYKVASGVYFYKLQTADKVMTKKMLLMK